MKLQPRVWLLAYCLSGFFPFTVAWAQQLEWVRQWGTSRYEFCTNVSADTLGNVYISGWTIGSLGGPNAGGLDAFVSKFDASGNQQWNRQLGTVKYDRSYGVSADSMGNVYISGYTEGSLGGPSAGKEDAFVSKYDVSGNLQWTRQLGTVEIDESYGVSSDSMGNVYISGHTWGILDGRYNGADDAFVSKYDASGNLYWTRQLGSAGTDWSYGVSADALGNVIVAGITGGSLSGTYAGKFDAFVSKFDIDGHMLWARQLGTAAYDYCRGVISDSLGNIYISGYTNGSLGGPNTGGYDAFVSKLDTEGNVVWPRQFGTADYDEGGGVSVDSMGNVYIAGYTYGSLGGPNAGGQDAFVSKFDASGNLQWNRQLGTVDSDESRGVVVDSLDNIYLSGFTTGSLGGLNAGEYDVFLAKFSSIPEPATLLLGTLGLTALLLRRAR